jgi:hypothetical protein
LVQACARQPVDLPANAGEGIHNNRLLQLAREGQKTTPQHLRRFDALHRHATLVAYLSERAGSLADEALDMHDRLVGEMLGKGEKARDENFRKRGKAINEKVGLYAENLASNDGLCRLLGEASCPLLSRSFGRCSWR